MRIGWAADAQTLRAGDIATVLFPLITFGIAYAKDDVEGEKQWLRDLGVNEVLNTGLRVAFNGTSWGRRPDGSSYGFPSGHAGFVFSQAGFLQERYGWTYGVPALTMATAISYIRVREDKHHWRDVIAGGALGYGVAMITVTSIKAPREAHIEMGDVCFGVERSRLPLARRVSISRVSPQPNTPRSRRNTERSALRSADRYLT